jgi:hypothetical protein
LKSKKKKGDAKYKAQEEAECNESEKGSDKEVIKETH